MTTSVTSQPLVDYYDLLAIDRDLPTGDIKEQLQSERVGRASQAARAGSQAEQARARITLIDAALDVFSSDEAREQYDMALLAQRREAPELAADPPEEQVDWTTRAWSYYFRNDDGPALIASRKAREQNPDDAMAFVVSAWVNLRDNEVKRAKQDADEAFVLDELGEDTTDVHFVRGAVQAVMGDHERAIVSFDRALAKAAGGERIEMLTRKAGSLTALRRDEESVKTLEEALATDADLLGRLADYVVEVGIEAVLTPATRPPRREEYDTRPVRAASQTLRKGPHHSPERARIADRLDEFADTSERFTLLCRKPDPKPDNWSFPLRAIGAGALFALMGAVSKVMLVLALACFVWAGFSFYQHSEKQKEIEVREGELKELKKLAEKLKGFEALALTA